eukprot:gene7958-9453_t
MTSFLTSAMYTWASQDARAASWAAHWEVSVWRVLKRHEGRGFEGLRPVNKPREKKRRADAAADVSATVENSGTLEAATEEVSVSEEEPHRQEGKVQIAANAVNHSDGCDVLSFGVSPASKAARGKVFVQWLLSTFGAEQL